MVQSNRCDSSIMITRCSKAKDSRFIRRSPGGQQNVQLLDEGHGDLVPQWEFDDVHVR